MDHLDPELLALLALGERPDDHAATHLVRCAPCATEVASLAAVVSTARAARDEGEDDLVAPPAATWEQVRGELGLRADVHPEREPAAVTPLPARRRTRPRAVWLAAAAAAGVALGAMSGPWWQQRDAGPALDLVAQAPLEALPGWTAAGSAEVHQGEDGSRVLVVSIDSGDEIAGFREVWLIDASVTRLVSLGVLEGSEGEFTVRSGLDLDEFVVVDVSDEPFDGDPAHSGVSIARGILES